MWRSGASFSNGFVSLLLYLLHLFHFVQHGVLAWIWQQRQIDSEELEMVENDARIGVVPSLG
ncbi:hypothetical protein M405DRAFT_803382 [Rhizopogon salebrosus TDB-379]|nr:hypothetical protein M405DRAFT_803382 [Rhizopogon salebrosus TDB-379]